MAYLPGYCELSYADANNESTDWTGSSVSEKNYAITVGRLYIDKNYTCENSLWDTDDYTTIPEEVQKANSVLAEEYVSNTLINTDPKVSGPITKKRVKAGSVESEIIYKGYYSRSSKSIDEQPETTMLLSPYCTLGSNGQNLIRV